MLLSPVISTASNQPLYNLIKKRKTILHRSLVEQRWLGVLPSFVCCMPVVLGMSQLFPQSSDSDVLLVGAETEYYNSRPSNSLRGSYKMTGSGRAIIFPMAFNKSCDECGIRKRKCDGNRPCRYIRRRTMIVVVLTCGLWHLLIPHMRRRCYVCVCVQREGILVVKYVVLPAGDNSARKSPSPEGQNLIIVIS